MSFSLCWWQNFRQVNCWTVRPIELSFLLFTRNFYRSLHVGSSEHTCVQNFRPIPLTVLRYWDSNWRTRMTMTMTRKIGEIDFLPYLPCLWSNSHQSLDAHTYWPQLSSCDVKSGLSLKVKVQIGVFEYTDIWAKTSSIPVQSTTVLCDINWTITQMHTGYDSTICTIGSNVCKQCNLRVNNNKQLLHSTFAHKRVLLIGTTIQPA